MVDLMELCQRFKACKTDEERKKFLENMTEEEKEALRQVVEWAKNTWEIFRQGATSMIRSLSDRWTNVYNSLPPETRRQIDEMAGGKH